MKKLFLSIFVLLALLTNVSIVQTKPNSITIYDLEKCTKQNHLNLKVGDQITYYLNSTAPRPDKIFHVYYLADLAQYYNLEQYFDIKVQNPQFAAGGTTHIILTLKQPLPKKDFYLDVQRYGYNNKVLLVSE